jgi:site-specific DNA-methyltransferase (adenine-specific)
MKDIPDKSIDMILCDLPYGTTACKWDVVIPFDKLWEQYKRIIKDKGCIALFGSEPFSSYLRMSNIKWYKYDWIWNKDKPNGSLLANIMPLKQHENITIFNAGIYFPIKEEAMIDRIRPLSKGNINGCINNTTGKMDNKTSESYEPSKRFPHSILTLSSYTKECNSVNRIHPTQKPVALLEYLIKTYTGENETILDNCIGSGSTAVACINTKRNFIGYEKEKKYFNIALERIKNTYKDKAACLF